LILCHKMQRPARSRPCETRYTTTRDSWQAFVALAVARGAQPTAAVGAGPRLRKGRASPFRWFPAERFRVAARTSFSRLFQPFCVGVREVRRLDRVPVAEALLRVACSAGTGDRDFGGLCRRLARRALTSSEIGQHVAERSGSL
jgi:hypothetical protein